MDTIHNQPPYDPKGDSDTLGKPRPYIAYPNLALFVGAVLCAIMLSLGLGMVWLLALVGGVYIGWMRVWVLLAIAWIMAWIYVMLFLVSNIMGKLSIIKFVKSKRPLLRWTYSQADWQRYKREQWDDQLEQVSFFPGQLIFMFAFLGMFIGMLIGVEQREQEAVLVLLIIGTCIGLAMGALFGGIILVSKYFEAWWNYHRAKRAMVVIGDCEILYGPNYFKSTGMSLYIHSVTLTEEPEPILTLVTHKRVSSTPPSIRKKIWTIPVPSHLVEEVRLVIAQMKLGEYRYQAIIEQGQRFLRYVIPQFPQFLQDTERDLPMHYTNKKSIDEHLTNFPHIDGLINIGAIILGIALITGAVGAAVYVGFLDIVWLTILGVMLIFWCGFFIILLPIGIMGFVLISNFLKSDRPLIRWQYNEQDWQKYKQKRWDDSTEGIKIIPGCMGGLFAVIGGLAGAMISIEEHGGEYALIGFIIGIFAGGALGAFMGGMITLSHYLLAKREMKEKSFTVALGEREVLFNKEYFRCNSINKRMEVHTLVKHPEPVLWVGLRGPKWKGKDHSVRSYKWKIPIPAHLVERVEAILPKMEGSYQIKDSATDEELEDEE
jgi:hypothetical protein